MKILITGGTGLIGREFIEKFNDEHFFTVLSRTPNKAKSLLGKDIDTIGSITDIQDIGIFDAVINLAGEPIADKRWTDTQKEKICKSRWEITADLVEKINASEQPPKVFISGSAIGYYGNKGDKIVSENTTPNKEFTYELCKKWEDIANSVKNEITRVVTLRTGVVLTSQGGALDKMALPFKLGVGGTLGSGCQYLSWIHLDDMVNAISFLLTNEDCAGPFNLTAPEPVTNRHFSKTLAKVLHRPCLFNVPSFVMNIVMGEASTMILEGQRVIPHNLLNMGFHFEYSGLNEALGDIYS